MRRVADFTKCSYHDSVHFRVVAKQGFEFWQRLGAANFRKRVYGTFAYPPVIVVGGFDQVIDSTFILGRVQNFDRRAANVLILFIDQLDHRIDDPRPADFTECIAGTRANPPIIVLDRIQQFFHRVFITDFVQYFHGCAARIF